MPQFQNALTQGEIGLSVFRQLKEDGELLKARQELYAKGIVSASFDLDIADVQDLLPSDSTIDLDAIEQSLRALSRCVAVSLLEREQLSHERECITAILHLLVSMVAVAVDEEEQDLGVKRQGELSWRSWC